MQHWGQPAAQSIPFPPGLGPSNYQLSTSETSFLQSLRTSHSKMDSNQNGMLPVTSLNHQPFSPTMSFFEQMRSNPLDSLFSTNNSHGYASHSQFANHLDAHNQPMYGANMADIFGDVGSRSNMLFDSVHSNLLNHPNADPLAPQVHNWREEFKALLPNVNVRFASDFGKTFDFAGNKHSYLVMPVSTGLFRKPPSAYAE